MLRVRIGTSNFREIVRDLFIDKSLFISELIDDAAKVLLFTRSRRWIKTSNLSMLHHFFSNQVDGEATAGLFDGLRIAGAADGRYVREHQGQYPVIFLSLKDIKENNIDDFYNAMRGILSRLYANFRELSVSDKLSEYDKEVFNSVIWKKISKDKLQDSLRFLSECLWQHYGKKVYILIDEYDAPIQDISDSSQQEVVLFFSAFFEAALKDNNALAKGVLMGILRVANANIFSGLNNLKECTLLDDVYSSYFGFTEQEVMSLFTAMKLEDHFAKARDWYNGYLIGGVTLYNPWSIVRCLDSRAKLEAYWVNTANNAQIGDALLKGDITIFQQLENLLQDESVIVDINKFINFDDLQRNPSAMWSLLFHTGYLTLDFIESTDDPLRYRCRVRFPNLEVKSLHVHYLKWWSSQLPSSRENYNRFIASFLIGNADIFTYELKQLLLDSFSYFDTSGKNPERVYHAFVMGLVADLHKTYIISSNHESGAGCYDVILIPKQEQRLGIIMEFKSIDRESSELEQQQAVHQALAQIKEKEYVSKLRQHKINDFLYVVIAFAGKQIALVHEKHEGLKSDAERQFELMGETVIPILDPSESTLSCVSTRKRSESRLHEDLSGGDQERHIDKRVVQACLERGYSRHRLQISQCWKIKS